jgi:hypothetical protein
MLPKSMIVVLLLAGWAAPAWAQSECRKGGTSFDQHLALGVTGPQADAAGGPAAPQQAPAPGTAAPRAPAAASQLDSVPNTGGVMDRPADQLKPLSGDLRRQVTALLEEAKAADAKGDGTVCADRLRQARQLAQQPSETPSDLH